MIQLIKKVSRTGAACARERIGASGKIQTTDLDRTEDREETVAVDLIAEPDRDANGTLKRGPSNDAMGSENKNQPLCVADFFYCPGIPAILPIGPKKSN